MRRMLAEIGSFVALGGQFHRGLLLDIHEGGRGGEHEEDARFILSGFLPCTHQAHGGYMAPVERMTKELDVFGLISNPPGALNVVPVELIAIAGEVKTRLGRNALLD